MELENSEFAKHERKGQALEKKQVNILNKV